MADKIYLNKTEQALAEFKQIQSLQFEMDKHKKTVRELQKRVRSLGQDIPGRIRKLKL